MGPAAPKDRGDDRYKASEQGADSLRWVGGGGTARRRHRLPLSQPARALLLPVCSGMANKKRGRDDELPEGVQEALDSLSQTLDRESTEQKMRVRRSRWPQQAVAAGCLTLGSCCSAWAAAQQPPSDAPDARKQHVVMV